MSKRKEKCKVCDKVIVQWQNVKLLRKLGYCAEHLPESLSCPAITQRGIRCDNPKQFPEDAVCKLHQRYIPKGETERLSQKKFRAKYENYLRSNEWKSKVLECKKRFMFRCAFCNRGNNLVVHHRTYENIFDEFQLDLLLLCDNCHNLFHQNYVIVAGRFIQKTHQKSKLRLD